MIKELIAPKRELTFTPIKESTKQEIVNKKLHAFSDLTYITKHKISVYDPEGREVPYSTFSSLSITELTKMINKKTWSFNRIIFSFGGWE